VKGWRVHRADWRRDQNAVRSVRRRVFIDEQRIPESLEWDGRDGAAAHVLAVDGAGTPVGTGRLLEDGRIGRMAVLPEARRRGIGRAMLENLMRLARSRGIEQVYLDAQVSVLDFYRQAGFESVSRTFFEAGIPHQRMKPVSGSLEGIESRAAGTRHRGGCPHRVHERLRADGSA